MVAHPLILGNNIVGFAGYSRLGSVGLVQWRAAVDKGVRSHSSSFCRRFHLARPNEHVGENERSAVDKAAEAWLRRECVKPKVHGGAFHASNE